MCTSLSRYEYVALIPSLYIWDLFAYSSYPLPTPYLIGTIVVGLPQKEDQEAHATVLAWPKEEHRAAVHL
jgi:hypothetical protein